MDTDTQYDTAVAKFNQLGTSTAENIADTYDTQKNVLINHYDNIEAKSAGFASAFWLGATSALIASNSAHNAWTAPDWETSKQEMPSVSLGFVAVFAAVALINKSRLKKTIQAVDRDVQDCVKNKTQPHM